MKEKFTLIASLLLIALVISLNLPLAESFWLDETISFWVIKDGLLDAFKRSWSHQGQSPLYFVLEWCTARFFGTAEWILRLPSILATLIAAGFVFQIGKLAFNRNTGAMASVLFLVNDQIIKAGISTRPYAFALACSLAAVLFFIKWFRSNSKKDLYIFFAAMVLAFYFHYLFLGALLAIAALLFAFGDRDFFQTRKRELLVGSGIMFAIMLPGLVHFILILSRQDLFSFNNNPDFDDFLSASFPLYYLIYALTVLIIALIAKLGAGFSFHLGTRENFKFIIAFALWAVVPPGLFFIHSLLSEAHSFIPRYFLYNIAGSSLVLAYLLNMIRPSSALFFGCLAALLLILTRETQRDWIIEDWAEIAEHLAYEQEQIAGPIIVFCGICRVDQ